MTRTPTALAILILTFAALFVGLCGAIVGAYVARPLCGLQANIAAMQGEIERAK